MSAFVADHQSEHNCWASMMSRCAWRNYGPNRPYMRSTYAHISVCKEWHSFRRFLEAVGPRPSMRHTLERIDNLKGYYPGNVRWATRKEQGQNKRNNRCFSINGIVRCLAAWCDIFSVNYKSIHTRVRRGWDLYTALITPREPLCKKI